MDFSATYACVAQRTDVVFNSALPLLADVKQHYFPELEKIRFAPAGTPPWSGGDLDAHIASIPALAKSWWMPQNAVASVIDIEHQRTPLDGSRACTQWVNATLAAWRSATGRPVALFDCNQERLVWSQDFLAPSLYPAREVVEYLALGEQPKTGAQPQASYAWYVRLVVTRLLDFAGHGRPIIGAVAPRYFATANVPALADGSPAPVPDAVLDLQIAAARSFGGAYVWDAPANQAQADWLAARLARVAKLA